MNVNNIYPGSEYAVFPNGKSRGGGFEPGAIRIRVYRTFKKPPEYGQKRSTAYVTAIRLTRDGEVYPGDNGNMREYRAYDVADFWDEYEDQLQHYEVEEEARQEKRRLQREEYDRQWRERREREERERIERERLKLEKRARVVEGLQKLGFTEDPEDVIAFEKEVRLTFDQFLNWLNQFEKQDCVVCGREITIVRLPGA
jgi:hypothetical protein